MERMVQGSKAGGSSAPTVASDTLSSTSYAQVLDLISEGPIYGPADSASFAQATYFNDTVVQNADESYNFTVTQLDMRLGTLDQTYISGFAASSNDVPVGVQLKATNPWVQTITDLDVNAVSVTLSVNALSQTDPNTGDVTGYTVAYQVQLQVDDGSFTTIVDTSFSGKASNLYTRTHRINVSGATAQYTIRVVRTTVDSESTPSLTSYVQDQTNVVSYSEIIDAQLRYPMSAVCGVQLDASQFSSIPTRSYDLKGLLINYPSNYNPATRVYTGTWDGTFVNGWTDNPAWVFYDLVLNNRYGLGRWVNESMIDRYSLYAIAQYCDVMVSDGMGGTEPRFTCNCYIASQADAYKVLQDLASVFRGMAYWSAGSVVATADMPLDTAYVYTAANVVGGSFKYVGSALKTRYNAANVTWNDPSNSYQQAVAYVEDADGIARYGLNKTDITAFACTSLGQAQRCGQWALLTSRYETNTVTFTVGLDGTIAQPGQIIAIADPARAGIRLGGRLHGVTDTATVTLDQPVTAAAGDTLTLVTAAGATETQTVQSVDGATITVSQGFSVLPVPGTVWMLQSSTLQAQLFRVSTVSDKDGISFEITATQYQPGKFAAIDDGAAIDVAPITSNTLTVQVPPTNITLSQFIVTAQGIANTNMTISWAAAPNAVQYSVQYQKDNGNWVSLGLTGGLSIDVTGVYSGSYVARVAAVNGMGLSSPYAYASATPITGKTGTPPTVATLTATTDQVFAINLAWTFPAGTGDTAYTEVYYSKTDDITTATQLSTYSYPTNSAQLLGLAAGYALYFWARLVDTTGNIGPWYPTGAGVQGESSADATQILTYLAGQISSTQLAQDVLGPIQAIPAIQTALTAAQQSITSTATSVTDETTAREAADEALSERIATVEAQYVTPPMAGDPDEYAGAVTAYAGVYSEQYARAAADTALAQQTDTLNAQLQTTSSTLTAAVNTVTQAQATTAAAQASQIATIQASVASNTASIQTNAQTAAAANAATAEQIVTVQANVAANTAAIQTNATAAATANAATAEQVSTIQASVTDLTASVQTNASSYAALNGSLSAQYNISTQITANGTRYIAGIGIGVNNTGGVLSSSVIVAASQFSVIDPNGTAVTAPFVVQGGQVFISQALIGTGWITNAMIGNTIQSNAVGANGQPRWIIDKTGTITLNGANNGSGYMTLNDSTIQVYDNNNVLRVQMGIW